MGVVRALVTVAALVLAVLGFGVPMVLVPVPFAIVGMGPVLGAGDERSRHELHSALRAAVGLVADDLGVHRACVTLGCGYRQQLHSALRTAVGVLADDFGVHRAGVHD